MMMDEKNLLEECRAMCIRMRKNSLKMSFAAGRTGAHLGGGLSMIEIMAVLYYAVMKINPKDTYSEQRDRFILSKGHGVLALYAAMYERGFFSEDDLENFKADNALLSGHPSMNQEKGIEFSSGSLGQGLSLGVGVCIALNRKNNFDSKVYVLLGDGECDEGSVWEAAASASYYNLKNLVAIIDKNGLQYDGRTQEVLSMSDMGNKWRSFGWEVREVDGHDVSELYHAFQTESDKPLAVIANTVKGKGISFMEDDPKWHHAQLTQKLYDMAMKELEDMT